MSGESGKLEFGMNFDTNVSLELVLTVLAILGAVWRIQHVLEARIDDLRKELKADNGALREQMQAGDTALRHEISNLREEMQAGDTALREEMQTGHAALREDMQAGDTALREDMQTGHAALREEMLAGHAAIRADMRRIEDKVDDNTQRLARLEGIVLAREGMVGTIVE